MWAVRLYTNITFEVLTAAKKSKLVFWLVAAC